MDKAARTWDNGKGAALNSALIATGMAGQNSLPALFERLAAAGLPTEYVRKVAFPRWWNDEIASDEAGYERALGFIHNTLNVPIDQLWNPTAKITCPVIGQVHFKKSKGANESDFAWARCIGVSAAELALAAIPPRDVSLPKDPREVRRQIMAKGHPHVDLSNLLDYLWDHGIPVLHIDRFPGKKMVGLAARVNDRTAIVLSKNHQFPSLMAFDLAHELGHILNGDLAPNDVILDEVIQRRETEPREIEATRTGIALLTGDPDRTYHKGLLSAYTSLSEWARRMGARDGVSPAVVVQNFGFVSRWFGAATNACKELEPNGDPVSLIRRKMEQELDFDELSDEEAHFLTQVAGEGAGDAVPARH